MAVRKVRLSVAEGNHTPEQGILDVIAKMLGSVPNDVLQAIMEKNEAKVKWCLENLDAGKQPFAINGMQAAIEGVLEEAREALDSE